MLIPLRNNLIVAAVDDPDLWGGSSLIIRPESTKDRSDQGVVKSVGPECREIKVGDYVMFQAYSGIVINDADEGDKLIMLTEPAVLAIITPPTTRADGLFVQGQDGFMPVTAEAALLIVRHTYQKLPRVAELRNKWEDRLKGLTHG